MATAGTLEYLISVDQSQLSGGLSGAEGKVKGFGNKISSWAVAKGQMLGNLATKAGQAAFNFVKGSVQESMGFDKAMSQVAATLGKSTSEIQELSDFARKMGSETAFTATEAAEALNYMALAGYDSEKSMRMLPTVLNLAAAGNMGLATASDMVTDAQSALGLTIEQTERMVDQMAKTSSKTNTSVEQLGDAFLTVGGTAKIMGGGVVDTTTEMSAVLGVLADNGVKGAEGGTALRNILLALSAPTDKAAKAIKGLGVEVFDSNGKMRDLPDIFSDINDAMEGMGDDEKTATLNEIFNKVDLKAVNALLGTNVSRWGELYKEINNADGAAKDMADTQLDNLAGDVTIFNSALGEAKLAIVEGLTPTIRKLVQNGTNWLSRLTTAFSKNGFAGAVQEAGNIIDSVIYYLKKSDSPVLQTLGKSLQGIKSVFTTVYGLFTDFPGTVASMRKSDSPFIQGLATALQGVHDAGQLALDLITDFPDKIAEMKQSESPFIRGLAMALEGVKTAVETVKGLFTDFEGTVNSMEQSDNPLLKGLAEALNLVRDGATGVIQLLEGDWRGAIATFRESDSEILSTVGTIADTFDQGRQRIQQFIDTVKEAFGVSGSNGQLYGSFAERMGHAFNENVTDDASMKTWLGDLKKGLQEAGMAAGDIDTVLNHFDRMGPDADPAGVLKSLKQLAGEDSPYGIDQLLETWKTLDAYYAENPVTVPEQPDLDEAMLQQENDKAQQFLNTNPLTQKIIVSYEFDPNAAAPQGTLNGIPSVSPDGSQASGLWNVPYDNYLANLHRNETVLTASQARQFKNGGSFGLDLETLFSGLSNAIRSGVENATVRSYLNGKDITRNVNRDTTNIAKARRYAT